MKLKRIICLFMMFFLLCPLYAFADDSGVLAEGELNEWVVKVLRDSAAGQPINAPVGEESHTEDGYAFIYDFATLYYDKPVLDQDSVLLAVSVTDEAYPGPRGIKLGDAQSVLIDTYGWQNPTLVGDGIFAAFYRLNSLPQSAYWSMGAAGRRRRNHGRAVRHPCAGVRRALYRCGRGVLSGGWRGDGHPRLWAEQLHQRR